MIPFCVEYYIKSTSSLIKEELKLTGRKRKLINFHRTLYKNNSFEIVFRNNLEIWRAGTMAMVASASVRRTREKRAERRGRREEGKGGLKIAGGGWVGTWGRRDACEEKKGGLRASAPLPSRESGGISGRTGEKHPLWMLEMGLEMERKGRSGKNGLREGKGRGVATRRGCKCPRDVSDRCGSTPLPQTPSLPLRSRLLRDLKTFSGWSADELRPSFSFHPKFPSWICAWKKERKFFFHPFHGFHMANFVEKEKKDFWWGGWR